VLFYGAFALFIGYFSTAPTYRHLPDDAALLRLSFSHPGKLKADCRKRTPEELAKIAPHLRTELECPRERSPVKVHLVLDGATLVDETIEPTGLHQDGAASVYRRIPITAGEHTLSVRLNDDVRVAGFNYTREARLQIQPGQIVLVDFAAERGGILIR
jgi:hypothetical protein